MTSLNEKLVEIKQDLKKGSKFIHGTYVWNYDLVNPNSKGDDLYKQKYDIQKKVLNQSFKNTNDLNNFLEENYKFKKFNTKMKNKMKDLGLGFDISYGWHKQVKMPKDVNGDHLPWFDFDRRLENLPNNLNVFNELMNEVKGTITDDSLNKDIKLYPEIINAGPKAITFCYGRFAFRNMKTKAFNNLGLTVIMLGPGSNQSYSGDFVPIDENYDVIITFRNKKTYGQLTERFIDQCKKLKINYYVEIYDAKDGNYQDLINYKPNFILNTIEKFKEYPVLYTDADMYINIYPEIFDQTYFDCMLYSWYSQVADFYQDYLTDAKVCYNNFKPRASGGTMWWGTSIQSRNALKIWDIVSQNNPGKSDDRVLDIVFNATNAMSNLKCYWLPNEFIYITDKLNGFGANLKHRWYLGEPVIIHPEDITSEEMAGTIASVANRHPADYFFSKSKGPNFDFSSERTFNPDDKKFKCFQNYDILKKNVFKPFKYHEEDENLIFRGINKNTKLFEPLRLRSKKTEEINVCEHIEYDFDFKLYNQKYVNEFVKSYKIIYNKDNRVYFTVYTENTKLYNSLTEEYKKIKKLINKEFGLIFILLSNKCRRQLLTATKFAFTHLEKHKLYDESIKILPIKGNAFNKDMDIFKIPASDEHHTYEYSNKFHTMNINVILADLKSDIIAVNYNSLMNINKECFDNNTLNIVPFSMLSLRNNHNIKYYIDKCIKQFDEIKSRQTNRFTEFRVMDNVYNVNMLSLYWSFEWLPEEYIIGIIYCEDYTCYSEEVSNYYKYKTIGDSQEILKWKKIQDKLKECYKTHLPLSSLYINYSKDFPIDFMIDFNEKYAIGKTPKDIKDKIPVTESVSIHEITRTDIPEDKEYRELVKKDENKIRPKVMKVPEKDNNPKPKQSPKKKEDKSKQKEAPKNKAERSRVIYSDKDDKVVKCEIDKSYLKNNVELDNKVNTQKNNDKNDMITMKSKDVKLLDSKISKLLEPNKLMIVAHPDDEMLWGGMNLLLDNGWHVIVATHGNQNDFRYNELKNSVKYAGVYQWDMFNIKDVYTEDQDKADKTFNNKSTPLYKNLLKLSKQKWDLVLTHNHLGEYGHAHHIAVHNLVKKIFKNPQFFKVDKKLNQDFLKQKKELCKYYADTQKICTYIYKNNTSSLKSSERNHYQNEKIYVKENRTIPKLVHQIWFGKEPPAWRKFMFNEVQRMCKKNGYEYKLWTMKDFNNKTIPITWDHIQDALEIGEDQAHNRWAQVADLARLDLVYKYGGIYMDSLFQVKDKFFKEMDKLIAKHEFIACNEEPVGLKEKWISNGFFASYPKSNILNNILVRETLNTIDLKKKNITQTTGPWYFRKAFNNIGKTKVHIIKPELIYPFLTHKDTVKRKQEPNKCLTKYNASIKDKLIEINKKNDMYMYKPQYCADMYKNSWVIYHSGLGGTWSY